MAHKIVVFGGNGFFGQRFVRLAVEKGYQVVSISRRGAPLPVERWHAKVEWIKGDVFEVKTWQMILSDATVVVDCIGIIRQRKREGITYEKFNVEATQIIASEARSQKVPLFVYLSANRFFPIVLNHYFNSKIRAEQQVKKYYPDALIIRPSLLVGKERKGTLFIEQMVHLVRKVPILSKICQSFRPQKVEQAAKDVLEQVNQKIKIGYKNQII